MIFLTLDQKNIWIFENFENLNLQKFLFCYENLIFLISFPLFHRLAGVIRLFCQRGFEIFSYRAPRRNFPDKPSLHRRLPPACNGGSPKNHEILNVREPGWGHAQPTPGFSFALYPARVV